MRLGRALEGKGATPNGSGENCQTLRHLPPKDTRAENLPALAPVRLPTGGLDENRAIDLVADWISTARHRMETEFSRTWLETEYHTMSPVYERTSAHNKISDDSA